MKIFHNLWKILVERISHKLWKNCGHKARDPFRGWVKDCSLRSRAYVGVLYLNQQISQKASPFFMCGWSCKRACDTSRIKKSRL